MARNQITLEQYIGFRKKQEFKEKRKVNITKVVAFCVLLVFCIVWLSPFVIMFFGSLRGFSDTMLYPKELFYPHSGYTLENYKMLLLGELPEGIGQANSVQDYKIGRWFLNSCFSAIGGTLLYLFVASLAAYAFTFINFKHRNTLFAIIIALSVTIARIKSLVLRNVKYFFFDEFIVNPEFKEKYLPNEAGRFKELYNTFYREATEPIKCFFLGNPYSHYNPYFTWLNVDTKSLYAGCIIAKDNYVVWLHQLSDKLKEWILSRNPLYEFDDSYRKYGFEGVPICDENIKLGDLPNNYYLRFLFRIEGKYIGVYKNYLYNDGEDKYWVGFISNFGKNRNVYCFEFSDLVNGCALISREDRNKFSNFRLAIQKRCILFEKIECYYLIEEIYKFL